MKTSDIQKLRDASLITAEQQGRIIAHFGLKEDGSQFLRILSFVGAALIGVGFTLLVAAHWDDIPRGVKMAAGILLMFGAHGAGWWLREVRGDYRKTGEALHLLGSFLFLTNIALVGQIYHLAARAPDAILLWWAGIAALPWLLKSKAQHILALLAFGIWFGMEINRPDSVIYFGNDEYQILLYALLGLVYLGFGYCLRPTRFADFAEPTERLGLLAFQMFAFPLTIGIWEHRHHQSPGSTVCPWIFPVLGGLALALIGCGMPMLKNITRQWRLTWGLALLGAVALLAGQMYFAPEENWNSGGLDSGYHWIAALGLFVFCLLQIQVGLQERSAAVVNLGIAFIAADIIATYFRLIGTMARTGTLFIASGVFLIVFAVYLEKKRRKFMRQVKSPSTLPPAT